jgi:hypothetical protein
LSFRPRFDLGDIAKFAHAVTCSTLYDESGASEHRLRQLVYLFFAALGLADRPGPRERRVFGFEVLASDKNQQQKNEQGIDSHCSPRSVAINLVAMAQGCLQGCF